MSWMSRTLARVGVGSAVAATGRHSPKDNLGRRGERLAARHLRRLGYTILARNVCIKIGEADIVCLAPDRLTIVIVEVKTRRRGRSVSIIANATAPEASVHAHKRRKLLAVTRFLARANHWQDRPIRIDVVAIEWPDNGDRPAVRHHIAAVATQPVHERFQGPSGFRR